MSSPSASLSVAAVATFTPSRRSASSSLERRVSS